MLGVNWLNFVGEQIKTVLFAEIDTHPRALLLAIFKRQAPLEALTNQGDDIQAQAG